MAAKTNGAPAPVGVEHQLDIAKSFVRIFRREIIAGIADGKLNAIKRRPTSADLRKGVEK